LSEAGPVQRTIGYITGRFGRSTKITMIDDHAVKSYGKELD